MPNYRHERAVTPSIADSAMRYPKHALSLWFQLPLLPGMHANTAIHHQRDHLSNTWAREGLHNPFRSTE